MIYKKTLALKGRKLNWIKFYRQNNFELALVTMKCINYRKKNWH